MKALCRNSPGLVAVVGAVLAAGCASSSTRGSVAGDSSGGTAAKPIIRVIALSHGPHPHNPAWYQVMVTLLDDKGASVLPAGAYSVRLTPPPGPDGRPPVVGGIVWERFDGNLFALTAANRLREDSENRGKAAQGEWREWRTLLKLPHDELADYVPAGSTQVQVTVEFKQADTGVAAVPASFVIPLRAPAATMRPPRTAVRRMALERLPVSGADPLDEYFVTLYGEAGEQTLPEGELRVAVAPRRGQEPAPTEAAAYTLVPPVEPPTRIGRRCLDPAKFEFRQRLLVDRTQMRKALPPGTSEAWVRIEFVPAGGLPSVGEALAVALSAG